MAEFVIDQDLKVLGNLTVAEVMSAMGLRAPSGLQFGLCKGGAVSGSSWADGADVVFPVPYPAGETPKVIILPVGGISLEIRRNLWTGAFDPARPARLDCSPQAVTNTQFTPRGRWLQPGATLTLRSDAFAGDTLTAVGHDDVATLANAPAHDDKYEVHFTIAVTPGGQPGTGAPDWIVPIYGTTSVTITVEANDGGGYDVVGGGTFGASAYDNNTVNIQASIPFTFAGLGASDTVKITITEMQLGPVGGSVSINTSSAAAVAYATAADAPIFASLTPDQASDASARLLWIAWI